MFGAERRDVEFLGELFERGEQDLALIWPRLPCGTTCEPPVRAFAGAETGAGRFLDQLGEFLVELLVDVLAVNDDLDMFFAGTDPWISTVCCNFWPFFSPPSPEEGVATAVAVSTGVSVAMPVDSVLLGSSVMEKPPLN